MWLVGALRIVEFIWILGCVKVAIECIGSGIANAATAFFVNLFGHLVRWVQRFQFHDVSVLHPCCFATLLFCFLSFLNLLSFHALIFHRDIVSYQKLVVTQIIWLQPANVFERGIIHLLVWFSLKATLLWIADGWLFDIASILSLQVNLFLKIVCIIVIVIIPLLKVKFHFVAISWRRYYVGELIFRLLVFIIWLIEVLLRWNAFIEIMFTIFVWFNQLVGKWQI